MPPIDQVVARLPIEDVVAVAAVQGQGDRIRPCETARVDGVVAREGVDRELVVRRFDPRDVHRGGQARDRDAGRRAGNHDPVGTARAVDDDGVGLAVAGAAAGRARQVEVHAGDAGAGQVVDGEGVGAAQGGDVDLLDAVDVHGHVADVAEQPQPAAVGREVDVLIGVGAVELQRVVAVLALDDVAAVAGVPHERVVAGAHEGHVVAAAADR